MTRTPMEVVDLGRAPYAEVLELQRRLARERVLGERDTDLLLLVEHEPVVTLGRGTRPESLPIAPEVLPARGVSVHEVERGGDVTFHGPGQLVGYPILDLNEHRRDLHWYLRQLEGALIAGLARLGIDARREAGRTGVWVEDRKIASMGIHVKQWVTFHGFALNVLTELSWFDLIVPCGIAGVRMTSVAAERPALPDPWAATRAAITAEVAAAFDREVARRDPGHVGWLAAAPGG